MVGPEPPGSGGHTGELLEGRYRLGELLGRGGMAEVRAAVDERLERSVAIKLLAASSGADPERFSSEIRTLARLEHPNIVRLLDAGETGERPYLVMELVVGESLAERRRAGTLPPAEVARIGSAVATGLAYVHAQGVVHRDVKPGNILLGPEERVRLADFGIARLVDTGGLTVTGTVLGTPAYLAPEQVAGSVVGPPADCYGLGLVLAECLLGRRLYDGPAVEVAAAKIHADRLVLEELEPAWRSLIAALTDPDPAQRPAADELVGTLAALAATDHFSDATRIIPVPEPATLRFPGHGAVGVAPGEDEVQTGRRRGALLAGALAAMVVAGAVGFGIERLVGSGGTASAHQALGPHETASRHAHRSVTTSSPSTTSSTTTSTSTTTTSTTTTTTTTTMPPTTTTLPSPTRAANDLVAAISSGVRGGTVSAVAAGTLYQALQSMAQGGPGGGYQQGINRLGGDLGYAIGAGGVSGAAVGTLTHDVDVLAASLGLNAPTIAPTPAPGPPGGDGGPGNNGGPGKAKGHGH